MDEALMGNTNSSLSPLGDSASTINKNSSDKKRAYTAIENISSSLNSISAQVTAQTEIAQRAQLIELAKSLGDMDMLRGLLADAQGGQAGGGAAAN
jgi:ferritin-like metal-binding protein YciE